MKEFVHDDPELRDFAEKVSKSAEEKLRCVSAVLHNDTLDPVEMLSEIDDIVHPLWPEPGRPLLLQDDEWQPDSSGGP